MSPGNDIFKNQPPYTYFNKCIEDPSDALYLHLNELTPQCLDVDEQENSAKNPFDNVVFTDPRTQRHVVQAKIKQKRKVKHLEIFNSKHRSDLSAADHMLLLDVLQADQKRLQLSEDILLKASLLNDTYQREKDIFQKFVYDYEHNFKQKVYGPMRQYVKLYRQHYQRQVERLVAEVPDQIYNTVHALPHITKAKCWSSTEEATITDCKLQSMKGWVQLWQPKAPKYQQIQHRLEAYSFDLPSVTNKLSEVQLTRFLTPACQANNVCYLNLDSLLLLMTSGCYLDLPTEMLLSIVTPANCFKKVLCFEKILPARHCGWHTHQLVVEQALQNFRCSSQVSKWIKVQNNKVQKHKWPKGHNEIEGGRFSGVYKLQKFEECCKSLTKCWHELPYSGNECLISFNLDTDLTIVVSLPLPPALNEQGSKFLGSNSIKLEHKPEFGCEVFTLHQLLHAWWQLKLLQSCGLADYAEIMRLSAKNLEALHEEQLSLSDLEIKLNQLHHLKMPQLLARLRSFLKMLFEAPAGQYMLRYNDKFLDKLVLAAPSTEIGRTSLFLHKLMQQTTPTDLAFMISQEYLNIADNLCNRMHLEHKIMPCLFRPLAAGQKLPKKTKKASKYALVDDRIGVLKKKQQAKEEKKKSMLKNKRLRKRANKKQRKQKKDNEEKKDTQDQNEFERWLESKT